MGVTGEKTRPNIKISSIINKKYLAIRMIGKGGYGLVFECARINSPNTRYAIKTELANLHNNLKSEWEIMCLLQEKKAKHIIIGVETGSERNYNYIIMHLVGPSLNDIRRSLPDKVFSSFTTSVCALQCFDSIAEIHALGLYVHRDVKPSNFAIGILGTPKERLIHILDFGICRKIIFKNHSANGDVLRKPRMKVPFRGTVQYCSLNVHLRLEPGRHDDFWSLLYSLVEFVLGELPWERMGKEEAKRAKEEKIDELLSKCPSEFKLFRSYLGTLHYGKDPDYDKMRNMFAHLVIVEKGAAKCEMLDWEDGGKHGDVFQSRKKYAIPIPLPKPRKGVNKKDKHRRSNSTEDKTSPMASIECKPKMALNEILSLPQNPIKLGDPEDNEENQDQTPNKSTSRSDDTLAGESEKNPRKKK